LTTIPIVLENGYVLLADGVDSQALADQLA
jgi:hypothetical protein